MYFKNLQPYRLSTEWPITAEALHEQLAKRPFHPCGSQDFESRGWVAPCEGADIVHAVGYDWLVCMQTETKILPPAVVQQEADKRAKEIEEQQGFRLGSKAMKDLREQITQELLPRAFTRSRKTYAWINVAAGWLVIDAASQSRAEDVLELLRISLDTFPVTLDAQALFDAEFALMTGELLRLLPAIVAAMGGELTRTPDLIDNAKEQA